MQLFDVDRTEQSAKDAGKMLGKKAAKKAGKGIIKLFGMLPLPVKVAVAIILAVALLIIVLEDAYPSAVWNQMTHVNESAYEEEFDDDSIDAVQEREKEIIDVIYGELDGDYENAISKIRKECRALGVDEYSSLATLTEPDRVDTSGLFEGGSDSYTAKEYEAVLLYSAYSLSIGQMQVEEMRDRKVKKDIRKKIREYLKDSGQKGYYSVEYAKDENGDIKIFDYIYHEGQSDEKIIKYVIPTVTCMDVSEIVDDMFPIKKKDFEYVYGEGSYDDRKAILTEMIDYNMELLHGMLDGEQAESDEDICLPITIRGKVKNGKITMDITGGFTAKGLSGTVKNGRFSIVKKDTTTPLDIPSGANRKSITFESQYDQSCWKLRLTKGSRQMEFNRKCRNEGGFRKYGNSYLVALGQYYGTNIGKDKYRIGFKNSDGKVVHIYAVLGDCKATGDTNPTMQYQKWDKSVVEFIMAGPNITQSDINKNSKYIHSKFSELVSIERAGQNISVKGVIKDGKIVIEGTADGVPFSAEGNVKKNGKFKATGFYGSGSAGGSAKLPKVAARYIGNVGGDKFQKWGGLGTNTWWCACFVSYCADKCGYIKSGRCPKFMNCEKGVAWFKSHKAWKSRKTAPVPGDIIFYDWGGDGRADHVGIVESYSKGKWSVIEGNTGGFGHHNDTCNRKTFGKGDRRYRCLLGYGVIK